MLLPGKACDPAQGNKNQGVATVTKLKHLCCRMMKWYRQQHLVTVVLVTLAFSLAASQTFQYSRGESV